MDDCFATFPIMSCNETKSANRPSDDPQPKQSRLVPIIANSLFSLLFGYLLLSYALNFNSAPIAKDKKQIGCPIQYISGWVVFIQFAICLLNVCSAATNSNRIRSIRDWAHHGIGVPHGFVIIVF